MGSALDLDPNGQDSDLGTGEMVEHLLTADMHDLILLFDQHGVRYMVVGGFAVNYYGYVRMTQDIDFLVQPSRENAERVMSALAEFGFGGAGIPRELFEKPGSVIHLGEEPNRIDLLTGLRGISNDEAFRDAAKVALGDTDVTMISLEHLITAKLASDRPRDRADADELSRIRG